MKQSTLEFAQRFGAWKEFHSRNPIVFELFSRYANDALVKGHRRFSARAIGERIRWHAEVETDDPDFKINDHHWPYYARLLAGTDLRFDGFFVFKGERFDADLVDIVAFHESLMQK